AVPVALAVPADASFPMQKHWPPGTQCVTKHDHTKPKARELAFRKGDMVTIIEAVEGKGWYRARHNETGQEGLLAASALRERGAIRVDPKLSLMPWFHGKISGVEAVQELQPPEDGMFLVRESVRHPGDYVLCVSFGKEVIHYRVVHEENTLSIDSQQYFSNLIDMIEHYMKEQGAICTKLVKPKPKTGMKSAEEELAKAGWLLNLQHLTLGDRIGQGEFGDVLQGEYMGQKVAVKNVKCDVTAQAFLAETAAMTKVRHKNLVCLLGVILHNGLYIVMEFMSKGNLVNFLRTRGRALVPTQQLLLFALDVAQGMDYLESKKLVHRDLAARNILISEENVAKVSDFGLARVNPKGADATLLPVKWTAPEALKHNKFSSKSDVWSYGILLWEAFSFGRAPYPKLSLKEVTELLEQGYRMDPPEGCPPTVYALMRSCWELEPGKRPSFKKLTEKLPENIPIGSISPNPLGWGEQPHDGAVPHAVGATRGVPSSCPGDRGQEGTPPLAGG
uniref:Tyrosine-protein kinase n=1 Tax=Otus sunia TaxID=257818 RepID=A0A8C8BFB3_9STRI